MNCFANTLSRSNFALGRTASLGMVAAVSMMFGPTAMTPNACAALEIFNQPQDAAEANNSDLWISFKFSGGTALDYVKAIRQTRDTSNIVVMPEAKMIEMPPVELRAVAVSSALKLLDGRESTLDGVRYVIDIDEIYGDTIPISENERQGEGFATNRTLPVYVVNVMSMSTRGGPRVPETSSQVWAVESLIGLLSADHLLAAIDVALPLSTGDDDPDIEVRFHEETGILIARGEVGALHMVNQVIEQLQQTGYTRMERENSARREAKAAEEEALKVQQFQLRSAFEHERSKWQTDHRELQSVIDTLRSELTTRDRRIQQLEEELVKIRSELARKK